MAIRNHSYYANIGTSRSTLYPSTCQIDGKQIVTVKDAYFSQIWKNYERT